MSMINKLIGAWVVNKAVSSTTPLIMRLLIGMAAISMVTIFTAFLAAIITGAGMWLAYHGLIASGITPANAVLLIGMFLFALLFVLAMIMQHYWRKVSTTFNQIVHMQSPVGGRVSSLVDSFIAGFHSPNTFR